VIPGARFQPVQNAGHLMQEDAPEAIVAAVLRWIGEASAG
jgi:pimeloyl-ACP methyl ester carboxylesterase